MTNNPNPTAPQSDPAAAPAVPWTLVAAGVLTILWGVGSGPLAVMMGLLTLGFGGPNPALGFIIVGAGLVLLIGGPVLGVWTTIGARRSRPWVVALAALAIAVDVVFIPAIRGLLMGIAASAALATIILLFLPASSRYVRS